MNDNQTKVLVVEDDKFLRGLLSQKLGASGFSVLLAADGREAVDKAKQEKPAVVLLDLMLPVLDGFEVLKNIKADGEIKSVPVIVLSNLGEKDEVQRALELGAVDYLIKAHFTPDEIIAKVREVLDIHKTEGLNPNAE